jgi:transposase InsO family protein
MRSDTQVPLPKGWPDHIRSGVIRVISLAHFSLTFARSVAANSINARIRLKAENSRLRQEIAILLEEARIKDSRMGCIPAQRRPHYPPIERMAILELRAARGWTLTQTARRFLVTPATIASWTQRLDEEGPGALVQIREPVNKFPDFVRYIVRRLKVLCPTMGKVKLAQVLCRAGLHLSSSSVGRMLRDPLKPKSRSESEAAVRVLTAKRPNHVWHVDLSAVPIAPGFWTAWMPWAAPQCWPFCWWIAVVVDHFSRRVMGFAVFEQPPTSVAIRAFLGRAIRQTRIVPRHMITDHGTQFTDEGFLRWCARRNIRQRFGAVGKYGSLAVIERLIRTIKDECTRRLIVPSRREGFRRELSLFITWYNGHRPHTKLNVRTPDEIYFGKPAACCAPRFEPRRRWPRGSPCAQPQVKVRGRRGARLDLHVSFRVNRKHLPIVELKRAA